MCIRESHRDYVWEATPEELERAGLVVRVPDSTWDALGALFDGRRL
jgi:hypothetical protein